MYLVFNYTLKLLTPYLRSRLSLNFQAIPTEVDGSLSITVASDFCIHATRYLHGQDIAVIVVQPAYLSNGSMARTL